MLFKGRRSTRMKKNGAFPVYLNVYDLTSMNGLGYRLGLGVHHSGVQVHGIEFAYGWHKYATTGIYEVEPKRCKGFIFRKQISIGWTNMSLVEVRVFMKELAQDYKGTSYNVITRNCNHFSNAVCLRLTGNAIPSWINRLARLGLPFKCLVPLCVCSSKVGIVDNKSYNDECMKEKPRISSSKFRLSCRPRRQKRRERSRPLSSSSSSKKSTLASSS